VNDRPAFPVQSLVRAARERALDPGSRGELDDALRRLSEPLRVAIAGRVKAGKSTLLNALLAEELAATDAGECTALVTWYRYGPVARAVVVLRTGERRSRPVAREGGAVEVDLGAPVEEVDHVEVHWPSSRLRDVTYLDTPGIASLSTEVSARTEAALAAGDRPAVADCVIYLLRHAHARDVAFLEAFHQEDLARGTPLNTVGVLSRADEIGSSRTDALEVAGRVATRYQHDRRLHRLCPVVVPVAGLLGQAGVSLREEEFRMVARLAAQPAAVTDELLLTAERVGGSDAVLPVTPLERSHLLERLGLFGLRLAVRTVRAGDAGSALDLSAELVRRSGLDRLRAVLHTQFAERSQLLRARSALETVRVVLDRGGCEDAAALAAGCEEITAAAHEFTEVRLLDRLREGTLGLSGQQAAEMERLLGGWGHGAACRLGLPADADPERIRREALAALTRWQRLAESPLTDRAAAVAARSVARSCEGVLSALAAGRG